ncbi:MAG: DUF2062 domain-containing protein [Desulfobulbus sp.]|jgi:uncharacterized protein (DUF2062 family)|nr:DUF2062 domain-containing protein [Desulfobulbus sp.]
MPVPRPIRYYLLRFLRLRGSPRSIALGAAIGATIGIAPTLPLNNVLTLFFTLLLRANPVAGLIAATVYSNPLTFFFQYYISWKIGDFLLPHRLSWERIQAAITHLRENGMLENLHIIQQLGWDAILVMLSGGLVLAVPGGIFTYVAVYRLTEKFQEKRRSKHLLNERRR